MPVQFAWAFLWARETFLTMLDSADGARSRKMALELNVESLDGLEDGVKSLYVQSDNGYTLDVAGLPVVEDVQPLKNALERQKQDARTYKQKAEALSRFEPLLDRDDFDPNNIDEILAKANSAGDPDAIARLEAKHKNALSTVSESNQALKDELSTLQGQIKDSNVTQAMRNAALKAGVFPEDVDDVIRLTRGNFDYEDNEVFVRDAEGHPTGVSPEDWFSRTYKEQRPKFFKGSGASGSGSHGTGSGRVVKKYSDMTDAEITEYVSKHGAEGLRKLRSGN